MPRVYRISILPAKNNIIIGAVVNVIRIRIRSYIQLPQNGQIHLYDEP